MIDSLDTSDAEGKQMYFLESFEKSSIPGFHKDSKRRQAKDKICHLYIHPAAKHFSMEIPLWILSVLMIQLGPLGNVSTFPNMKANSW